MKSDPKKVFDSVARTAAVRGSIVLCILLGSWLVVAPSLAQEGDRSFEDLTGRQLVEDDLSKALAPRVERPPLARSMQAPSCVWYRKQMSRGFTVEPVSQEIAITVEFASDSAELTTAAQENLDVLGAVLRTGELADCCFRVEGHTDSQNTEDYNEALSERRAASVVEYLRKKFEIDPDRLLQEGHGESAPLATNETPEGRQKNRRVEISNLGFQKTEGGS